MTFIYLFIVVSIIFMMLFISTVLVPYGCGVDSYLTRFVFITDYKLFFTCE